MATKNKSKPCRQRKSSGNGTSSFRNILDKPRAVKSSCSTKLEKWELPSIEEKRRSRRPDRHDNGDCPQSVVSFPRMSDSSCTLSVRSGSDQSRSKPASSPSASVTSLGGCFLKNPAKTEEIPDKVVGPSDCAASFEVPVSDETDHTIGLDRTVIEESKALKNWERWMRIRRTQNDSLAERTRRDKCKLVLNTADDVRQIKEDKELLTYARIPPTDKWRGNPQFWKEPTALAVRGMSSKYYAYDPMCERGIVPPLEFVSVPDAMKVEKDALCDEESRLRAWQRLEYRKEQCEKYADRLREMAPHKADAKDLIILGRKLAPSEETEITPRYELPVIEITSPEEEEDGCDSVALLVVNGVELKFPKDRNSPDKRDHAWSLIFEEAPVGTLTSSALHVENRGTVAVRYDWVHRKHDSNLTGLPWRRTASCSPCFFFDKNPGVFLPGQKNDLNFYHYSKNPGYHAETYYLKLDPNLFGEEGSGKVRLIAVAGNTQTLQDFLKIDKYLDACVTETVVKQIVDELFERAKPKIPEDIEYRSLFMEEELFEFQNPAHYYRYDVADELKSLFKEIPMDPPQEWDLNLFTLEDLIRTFVTGKPQREMLCKLMELSRSLLRPGPECYKVNKKRKMLYNALCSLIDDMEAKAKRIREVFSRGDEADWAESEEEYPGTVSAKSGRSHTSGFTSLGEEASSSEKGASVKTVFEVSYKDLALYRNALYTTFYFSLCEAAELCAGVVESCRLFEHHGEVLNMESSDFFMEYDY